jgi:hypothetical protein
MSKEVRRRRLKRLKASARQASRRFDLSKRNTRRIISIIQQFGDITDPRAAQWMLKYLKDLSHENS